jgi:asparagine synthetase B (glutamine-hydrolysing)
MCGIIGGNLFQDEDKLTQGLQSMMHRGTDGNIIFSFKGGMHLSHNRLSIQDLSEVANQPMVSDDSRYYLAFNGELWKTSFDNFDKKLRDKYNFKTTNSDSELLLYFLIDNIDDLSSALNNIDGMFCFALYDSETDTTYLGRDFIGRLPFYYTVDNDRFAFSIRSVNTRIRKLYTRLNLVIYLSLVHLKLTNKDTIYKRSSGLSSKVSMIKNVINTTLEQHKSLENLISLIKVWTIM